MELAVMQENSLHSSETSVSDLKDLYSVYACQYGICIPCGNGKCQMFELTQFIKLKYRYLQLLSD